MGLPGKGKPSDFWFPPREEWRELHIEACPTEGKRWARLRFWLTGHWPQRVVDERLAFTDRPIPARLVPRLGLDDPYPPPGWGVHGRRFTMPYQEEA